MLRRSRGYGVTPVQDRNYFNAIYFREHGEILFEIAMEKMVGFIKLYFPGFLLGAIFGKVVEMSGLAESIAKTIVQLVRVKNPAAKLAVFDFTPEGMVLVETQEGVSVEEIKEKIEAFFTISPTLLVDDIHL